MYRKEDKNQKRLDIFVLPFGGKLDEKNRWVTLAGLIPWDEIEAEYSKGFSKNRGAPGLSSRIALGSLIIKEKCRYTDDETVNQIRENPYLQFFLGFERYSYDIPFDSSMMTHFRKRFKPETIQQINELIVGKKRDDKKDNDDVDKPSSPKQKNKGKLIVDATCTPADIRFPTDLSLLNEAREKTEKIIDKLYGLTESKDKKKPRTYRVIAHKFFLTAIKSKKNTSKKMRVHIGKQLRFLKRNLNSIKNISLNTGLENLSKKEYKDLLVISELFRQQHEMYQTSIHRIDDRIVSISQPHVRPIVRGKASAMTEFGAKISMSVVNGSTFIDAIRWSNFNEGADLPEQIENYRDRFGCYPKSVHADKKYQSRVNRDYCKKLGIELSGVPLGRKSSDKVVNAKVRRKMIEDMKYRVRVEGKIGVCKRRYSMDRVMAKLEQTAKTVIHLAVLTMNLDKKLRDFLSYIFGFFELKLSFKTFFSRA